MQTKKAPPHKAGKIHIWCLDQAEVWVNKDGEEVELHTMSLNYLKNLQKWLKSRAIDLCYLCNQNAGGLGLRGLTVENAQAIIQETVMYKRLVELQKIKESGQGFLL